MSDQKPFSPACEKNQTYILEALKPLLEFKKNLLEVGSGTGQHAVFMAPKLSHLTWTLSDLQERHSDIKEWLHSHPSANLKGPVDYAAGATDFPIGEYDVVFTANTLHIMSWETVLKFFSDLGDNLNPGALFVVYGAFKYDGEFTSESNKEFDLWLKDADPKRGVRDFELISSELRKQKFEFLKDQNMPSNNQLLLFKKA